MEIFLLLDEEDGSSSDEEEADTNNKKAKLDRIKDHPVKFYRNDNKDRFGKPMTNPILAENVKGILCCFYGHDIVAF